MVNRINRLGSFVAALAFSIVSVSAAATDIDNVVFFGDSLSDTGNVWIATGGFPPPPYFQGSAGAGPDFTGGQWSSPEGPSWPTLFASRFNQTATPSLVPVSYANNFAWGGARTGVSNSEDPTPWLDQQVAQYLTPFLVSGTSPTAETLVSIMIGGNDVANNLGDQAALQAGITSITNQMTNLYNQGVRQFLITNVPDIGDTPEFQDRGSDIATFATFWTIQWNAALAAALGELELPGAVINFFDFYSFSKDPELLTLFENTTDACLTATMLCSDPASYFYWDSFHPSSTSHRLLADALYQNLVPVRLQQLLEDVAGVGPGKSLSSKVARVQASYDGDKYQAACGQLNGFINQVDAQAGKSLTSDEADAFSAEASAIGDAIGCG
ncbi:SGNH/GDSL hydrolase family protein [bacterium]|nr:SGNH/GDSL hydrolase family protein [bacterium]